MRDENREDRDAYWIRQLRGITMTLKSDAFNWTDAARVQWVYQELMFLIQSNEPNKSEIAS